MYSLQIIDDDVNVLQSLSEFFEDEGYEVFRYKNGEAALSAIKNDLPNVVLLDLKLPGLDGFTILEKIKKSHPDIEVIIITGNVDVMSGVKAMKLGAIDYVTKPFNLDEISVVVEKAIAAQKQYEQLVYLQKERKLFSGEIIGTSQAIQEVFKFINQVAESSRTSVLIDGETGTGKELVVRAIHYGSSRANKPFIEINCSAFQSTLLESELFGYEPGAFTDAKHRKKGLLELADGGSFFLDEIGEMDIGLQVKLLKVIEEQSFRRIGGTKQIKIDTRIFSATSRDLVREVAEGRFRKDLFYRLNVASIKLPPLRERGDDIFLLADHFIRQYNIEFKRNIHGLDEPVINLFKKYSWPGNVRELRNVIERAMLFEKGSTISLDSINIMALPDLENSPSQDGNNTKNTQNLHLNFDLANEQYSLMDFEKQLFLKVLEITHGNQSKAAGILGISRQRMSYRVKVLGITPEIN
ncbi:MAG: sigma-54-dependent Fis family transcriptional regulator [Candidatus Marinimicrobia bacterium]|nr:sigma-54-dependent Fis family transcriptional regulator [Candidatus Neomarinimicrobiota bacterium]